MRFKPDAGMSRSQRLTLRDVRAVYRLIGDCRDLADDPVAWRTHLYKSLHGLLGAHVVLGHDYRAFWTSRPTVLPPVVVGEWNEAEQGRFFDYFKAHERFFESPVYRTFAALPGPVRLRSRRGLHSLRSWHRSAYYNDGHRPSDVDEYILSYWSDPTTPDGRTDLLSVHRATGEEPFSRRLVRMVRLLHSELGPMIGRQLSSAAEPSPSDLPPRVRQVLDCLLEGDSEKQIAQRLQLSRPTVHQYVGVIYHHFAVQSRGELLARWVRFVRSGQNS